MAMTLLAVDTTGGQAFGARSRAGFAGLSTQLYAVAALFGTPLLKQFAK